MELNINNLTLKYGEKIAVDNFSTKITQGVYGLLGANGSGKTTLMRLICDILKSTEGEITYGGKDISRLGEEYRDVLGYLPQQFGYYPDFTAYDYMMYISSLKGLGGNDSRKKALELLKTMNLLHEKDNKIKNFSVGMRQRLGIAQAMINDPKILILDEPTAGLDPKERVAFRNLISSFSKDRIIILSTHIVSDVEYIADEIIMMKHGKLINRGNVEDIIKAIEKSVWEVTVNSTDARKIYDEFIVSNHKRKGDNDILRIVSDNKPHDDAINITPILEDLYLYYFQEVEVNENINQI